MNFSKITTVFESREFQNNNLCFNVIKIIIINGEKSGEFLRISKRLYRL